MLINLYILLNICQSRGEEDVAMSRRMSTDTIYATSLIIRSIRLANAGDGSPTSGAGEAARGRTEPVAGEDSRTLSGPGVGRGVAVEDPGA